MIDEAILQRFYSDVPAARLERYRSFLGSHDLSRVSIGDVEVEYLAGGSGDRTLLSFCGAHSTPNTPWETIESYEGDHRVVVIDISAFGSVAELVAGIDRILEIEKVERVVLLGASLAGLIAQIYLRHNFNRVDGMVLMNTMAMKPSGDKPLSLLLTRLMPAAMLRAIFHKKLKKYFEKALADPRAADGARFGLAHLEEVMALHFTKRKVIHLLSVLFEFCREGYTREDLGAWNGRALVIVSEDDEGYRDLEWLLENLPDASSEVIPAGLGHLPQLAHRDKFDSRIREFLASLE